MFDQQRQQHGGTAIGVVGGAVVNYAATVAPPALGRITEATEQTRHLTDSLANELGALAQRIAPILRPDSPANQTGGATPVRATPSEFAAGVEGINERLYQMIGAVQSLAARVDL